jgi:hypothetical protein
MKILILLITLINPDLKEEKITINKTYELESPKDMVVLIDNIFGSISVEPSNDNKVYLTLEIEISAGNESLMQKAKNELQLGEVFAHDTLLFYTRAPFVKRTKWGNNWGRDMHEGPKYSFKYKYTLKVPKDVILEAKTVNKGNVYVRDIATVKACNVNGSIEIKNVNQVLQASTVNGDVTINFLENPKNHIDFNTINGDFNLELPKNLNARVFFDSMNGDLFTAFDYQKLIPKVEKSEKNGTYKIGTKSGVEIGSGGPELSFKSINGNVYLKKSTK